MSKKFTRKTSKKFTRKQIVEGAVKYIIENGPVTYTELGRRAMSNSWYTRHTFDQLVEILHRHPQITASVRDDDVYYRKKISRPRARQAPPQRPDYPDPDPMMGIHPIFEEYDKSCNCTLHATREEIQEFKKDGRHARLCNLQPERRKKIEDLYNKYYERESDTDRNTQETFKQGRLCLEK